MKRILACLLILVMIFAFAACNNDNNEESKPADESSTAPVNSVDDTSTPADESSKPEESSAAPVESSDVEESSTVVTPPPAREEAEEPSNHIWLLTSDADEKSTVIQWRIDASAFEGKSDIRIFADVKFEDIVSIDGGLAYVNIYFYGESGALLDFEDWASSREVAEDEMGKWYTYEYRFEIPNIETDDDKLSYATVAIGFWNAYGKISCGPINLSAQKEMFWGKPFNTDLDLDAEDIDASGTANISAGTQGLNWEVVYKQQESVGTNLAAEEGASVTLVKGEVVGTTEELKYAADTPYGGSLNDGICGAGELGDSSWFGFHPTKTLESGKSIDDQSGQMGIVIIDLGSEQEFNRIRAFHWSPAEWGIASLIASRAYYSNDGEEWTEYGDLLINSEDKVGWADTDVSSTVSARYVKVELLFGSGSWGMIGEIEVISAKQDVVE